MESYFIKNFDGAEICIVDNHKTDAKQALLFVHGSNLNSDIFEHQFGSELLNKYRLVAINMPGNGKSQPANNPKEVYQFKGLVDTLEFCVKALALPQAIYVVGHSMGAHLVTNNINSPQLYKGAFFVGYPPLHEVKNFYDATHRIPSFQMLFSEKMNKSASSQVADDLMSGKASNVKIQAILDSVEPLFRRYYGSSIANGVLCDEYDTINGFECPIVLTHAEQDRFLKYEYIKQAQVSNLWRSKVHLFSNASHIPFIDAADQVNELIDAYVLDVSGNGA